MNKQQRTRAAHDRRDTDAGPPSGWKDRRRNAERRIPAVEETNISEDEWSLYFGAGAAKRAQTTLAVGDDIAAEVLAKAGR